MQVCMENQSFNKESNVNIKSILLLVHCTYLHFFFKDMEIDLAELHPTKYKKKSSTVWELYHNSDVTNCK